MQDVSNTPPTSDHHISILTDLNADYIRAVEECDVAWFDEHLADDFMNSNPDGTLVDRPGFLSQIARGSGLSGIAAEDVIVRVCDDLGIIHAQSTFTMPSGEAGTGRYTDVWSLRHARWLCVAAQVTRC